MKKCFIACIVLALCRCASAGEDPEILIRQAPAAWQYSSIIPVRIDIRSSRPTRVDVSVFSSRYGNTATIEQSAAVGANSTASLEFASLPTEGASVRIRCEAGGRTVEREFYRDSFDHPYKYNSYPLQAFCGNGLMLRELSAFTNPSSGDDIASETISLEELPRQWQSYASLFGILILDAAEAGRLGPDQRHAIGMWVKWVGGRVLLAGESAEEAAVALGLAARPEPTARIGATKGYRQMAGWVYCQAEANAAEAAEIIEGAKAGYLDRFDFDMDSLMLQRRSLWWLLEGLGGVSVAAMIACLILLGLVMGPLNYWYIVRKRRNSLLFFITTPAIALFGTLAIIAASMAGEGFGGTYREHAVLFRRAGSDEGMLVDARGIRPGFFAPELVYPDEALLNPMWRGWQSENYAMRIGNGQRLSSGWVKPRSASGVLAALPVACRMNVEIEKDGDEWVAVNNLGYEISLVTARLPDNRVGRAEWVKPGERKRLIVERESGHMRRVYDGVSEMTALHFTHEAVQVVAKCSGLPYIADWGVNGSRIDGAYYYVAVAADGGEAADDE